MHIRWDEESWESIMQQLRHAQLGLKDVLDAATADRNALEEMNPDREDKALCRISDRYYRVYNRMQRSEQELDNLIRAMKRAEYCFIDAEDDIKKDLNNLSKGNGSKNKRADETGFAANSDWRPPQVVLFETLYSGNTGVIVPDWLSRSVDQHWSLQ